MCYNLETSIITFTSAMASGLLAIHFKQYILGMLILCYGQMQLSELLIWISIKNNDDNLNRIGTNYGKYLLPAHNIAIGLGIYIRTKNILPLIIGLLFYIVILIVYNFTSRNTITKAGCEEKKECNKYSGKLQWPYEHKWYIYSIIISLLLCFYYIKPFFPTSIFISIFYSFIFTIVWFFNKNDAYGSYFCVISAMFAPLLVIFNIYLTSKYPNFIS